MAEEVGAKLLPHATDTYEMLHGGMVDQFKGKQVSLVGKVEEHKGSTFSIRCHNDRKVKVVNFSDKPPLGQPISEGKIVEVRGALGSGDAVLSFHDLVVYGDDFGIFKPSIRNSIDMQQHAEMVNYYHKFCKDN